MSFEKTKKQVIDKLENTMVITEKILKDVRKAKTNFQILKIVAKNKKHFKKKSI